MSNIDEALDPRRLKARWVKPADLDPHPGSSAFANVDAATDPGATARIILHTIRHRAMLALPNEATQLEAMSARVEGILNRIAGEPQLDDEGRAVDLYTHAARCDDTGEKTNLPAHPTGDDDIESVGELLSAIGDFEDVVSVLLRYGFPR